MRFGWRHQRCFKLMSSRFAAGQVCYAELSGQESRGAETKGTRGARFFVLLNKVSVPPNLWLGAPLLEWKPFHERHPYYFLKLSPTKSNGLDQDRTADLFQLRAIDLHARHAKPIGKITDSELNACRFILHAIAGPE
jgi:hypothetical protein